MGKRKNPNHSLSAASTSASGNALAQQSLKAPQFIYMFDKKRPPQTLLDAKTTLPRSQDDDFLNALRHRLACDIVRILHAPALQGAAAWVRNYFDKLEEPKIPWNGQQVATRMTSLHNFLLLRKGIQLIEMLDRIMLTIPFSSSTTPDHRLTTIKRWKLHLIQLCEAHMSCGGENIKQRRYPLDSIANIKQILKLLQEYCSNLSRNYVDLLGYINNFNYYNAISLILFFKVLDTKQEDPETQALLTSLHRQHQSSIIALQQRMSTTSCPVLQKKLGEYWEKYIETEVLFRAIQKYDLAHSGISFSLDEAQQANISPLLYRFNRYPELREELKPFIIQELWSGNYMTAILHLFKCLSYQSEQDQALVHWALVDKEFPADTLIANVDESHRTYCSLFHRSFCSLYSLKIIFPAPVLSLQEQLRLLAVDIEELTPHRHEVAKEIYPKLAGFTISIFTLFQEELRERSPAELLAWQTAMQYVATILRCFENHALCPEQTLAVSHLLHFFERKINQVQVLVASAPSTPSLSEEERAQLEQTLIIEDEKRIANENKRLAQIKRQQDTAVEYRNVLQQQKRQQRALTKAQSFSQSEQKNVDIDHSPSTEYYKNQINALFLAALTHSSDLDMHVAIDFMNQANALAQQMGDEGLIARSRVIYCHYTTRQMTIDFEQITRDQRVLLIELDAFFLPSLLTQYNLFPPSQEYNPLKSEDYRDILPLPQSFIDAIMEQHPDEDALTTRILPLVHTLRKRQYYAIQLARESLHLKTLFEQIEATLHSLNSGLPSEYLVAMNGIRYTLQALKNKLIENIVVMDPWLTMTYRELSWRRDLQAHLETHYGLVFKKRQRHAHGHNPFSTYTAFREHMFNMEESSVYPLSEPLASLEDLDRTLLADMLHDIPLTLVEKQSETSEEEQTLEDEYIISGQDSTILVAHPALFHLCAMLQQPEQPFYLVGGSVRQILLALFDEYRDPNTHPVLSDNIEFDAVVPEGREDLIKRIHDGHSHLQHYEAPYPSPYVEGLVVLKVPIENQITAHDVLSRGAPIDVAHEASSRDTTRSAIFLELVGLQPSQKLCVFKIHEPIPGSIEDVWHHRFRAISGKAEGTIKSPQHIRRMIKVLLQKEHLNEEDRTFLEKKGRDILLESPIALQQMRQLIAGLYQEADNAFDALKNYSARLSTTADERLRQKYHQKILCAHKELDWLLPEGEGAHLISNIATLHYQVRQRLVTILEEYHFLQLIPALKEELIANNSFEQFAKKIIDLMELTAKEAVFQNGEWYTITRSSSGQLPAGPVDDSFSSPKCGREPMEHLPPIATNPAGLFYPALTPVPTPLDLSHTPTRQRRLTI